MGTLDIGKKGEDLALEYLTQKGLVLLTRNWHWGHCELDLVMMNKEFIHFIEVKSLRYPNNTEPFEAVNAKKRKNLFFAARGFLKSWEWNDKLHRNILCKEVVFDIVSVVFNGDFYTIEHIENAFSPTW